MLILLFLASFFNYRALVQPLPQPSLFPRSSSMVFVACSLQRLLRLNPPPLFFSAPQPYPPHPRPGIFFHLAFAFGLLFFYSGLFHLFTRKSGLSFSTVGLRPVIFSTPLAWAFAALFSLFVVDICTLIDDAFLSSLFPHTGFPRCGLATGVMARLNLRSRISKIENIEVHPVPLPLKWTSRCPKTPFPQRRFLFLEALVP